LSEGIATSRRLYLHVSFLRRQKGRKMSFVRIKNDTRMTRFAVRGAGFA
jgi:hypothetical protein